MVCVCCLNVRYCAFLVCMVRNEGILGLEVLIMFACGSLSQMAQKEEVKAVCGLQDDTERSVEWY